MKKIVGIIGSGNIGRDPFDPQSWSGCSRQFFTHCQDRGLLHRAFGGELSLMQFYLHALRNFSFNRDYMRKKLYLDVRYCMDLTSKLSKMLKLGDFDHVLLQAGAIYDIPSAANGKARCVSYNDGNIAQAMRSPYFDSRLKEYGEKSFLWQKGVNSKLDKIFTFSEYLRGSFIDDFDISPDKVACIGVGANISPPVSCPDKDEECQDILILGSDFIRKGGELVVDAFLSIASKHKKARLIVIGPNKVPKKIVDNPHDRIVFVGFLSKSDGSQMQALNYWLKRCRIGVLASFYEPFGVAIVECQMFGMPCIAVNAWAFPEMIANDVNGFLVGKHSSAEIADVLDYYLSNPSIITQHGKAAYATAAKKYSWSNVVRNLESELEAL